MTSHIRRLAVAGAALLLACHAAHADFFAPGGGGGGGGATIPSVVTTHALCGAGAANSATDCSTGLTLPNGAGATTQAAGDATANLATDQFVSAAFAGVQTVPLIAGSNTLTAAQYGTRTIVFTDPTAAVAPTAVMPNSGNWLIYNSTGQTMAVTTATGTGVVVQPNWHGYVAANGTNVVFGQPRGAGNYYASNIMPHSVVPAIFGAFNNSLNAGADVGGTYQVAAVVNNQSGGHGFVLEIDNSYSASAGEVFNPAPMTVCLTFDYPANIFSPITFRRTSFAIPTGVSSPAYTPCYTLAPGEKAVSDPVNIDVPAATAFNVREMVMTEQKPTALAGAVSTTGGTLNVGTTQRCYWMTAIGGAQGESNANATAYQTGIVAGSTSAVTLTGTLVAPASATGAGSYQVPTTAVGIYELTSASCASSATATLIAVVPVASTPRAPVTTVVWTDTGAYANGTANPPTAAQQYPIAWTIDGSVHGATETGNPVSSGSGNASNQLYTSGTAWGSSNFVTGPAPAWVAYTPDLGVEQASVCYYGDSIFAGQNSTIPNQGYFMYALENNSTTVGAYPGPRGGEGFLNVMPNTLQGAIRIGRAEGCSVAVIDDGANDIIGYSLAQLQANGLAAWTEMAKRASYVYQTTVLPRVAIYGSASHNMADQITQVPGETPSTVPVPVTAITIASPPVLSATISTFAVSGEPVAVRGFAANGVTGLPDGDYYACAVTTTSIALYTNAACTTPVSGLGGAYGGTGGGIGAFWVEAARTGFNDWLRCGAPINIPWWSGTPTPNACGTTGAILAGQLGHPLSGGVFDAASKVETNISGTLTLDGHYWTVDTPLTITAATAATPPVLSFTNSYTTACQWVYLEQGLPGLGVSAGLYTIQSISGTGASLYTGSNATCLSNTAIAASGTYTGSGTINRTNYYTDDIGTHPASPLYPTLAPAISVPALLATAP